MVGIINGLGKQSFSLITSAAGYIITIGFIWFGVPVYGMDAYIWGSIISIAVTVILNLCFIIKTTGLAVNLRNWVLKPSVIAVACIPTYFLTEYFPINNEFLHLAVSGSFVCLTVLVLVATMFRKQKWGEMIWLKIQRKK